MRAIAFSTAVLILTGCAGGNGSAPAATRAATAAETGAGKTEPRAETGGQAIAPPDVAPLGSLRKIRALEGKFSHVDPRLEEGVRAVSGIVSEVRCWTKAGWRRLEAAQGVEPGTLGGLADPFAYEIHLHPYVCEWLDALLKGVRPETGDDALQAAQSLITLAHEGTHFTAAGGNEAVVECRAMQNADKVAVALGIEADYAQRLSQLFWEQLYAKGDPIYGSPECRDGGIMDVNPAEHTWP